MTLPYAIVTPYYKEERGMLERCIASVRNQTIPCDHILVADGFPQDWLDGAGVRHLRLDRAHGDYGDVARGLGALLAAGEGYEAIGFLDADNWYDHDHVEACMGAAAQGPSPVDVVTARRRFVRPDGSSMPVQEDEGHVDTSCFWFLPGSFHLLRFWVTIPQALALVGDRIFMALVRDDKLTLAAVERPTVNYLCLWEKNYRDLGETPPPGAKPNLTVDLAAIYNAMSPEQRRVLPRLAGINLVPAPRSDG